MRALGASRTSLVPGGALAGGWTRNALWKTARAVPSLDLRFADNKSLVDAVTGAQLVTFTRASSGTFVGSDGVLQTATTNEPRFDHNPTTGESLGLLVEEARTNLLLQSEDFSTTWSVDGSISIATNTLASPSSTLTADTLTVSGGGANRISQSYSVPSAGTYTLTIYAKAGTGNLLQLRQFLTGNDAYSIFNFTTGVMGAVSGGTSASASATALQNGWYRLALTNTYSGAATINIRIGGAVGSTETNTTFYIWGAQLEAGAFPTSYIPTTTAAATRAADVATISNANLLPWFTSFNEHTFYAELRGEPPKGPGGIIMEGLVSGALGGATLALNNTSTRFRSQQRTGPSRFDAGNNNGSLLNNTINRVALGASALGSQSGENGLLPTTASVPAQADWDSGSALSLGKRSSNSTVFLNGCIARFAYWPTRHGNEVLQRISQP